MKTKPELERELFASYDFLRKFALRLWKGRKAEAEDLLQETMLGAWCGLDSFQQRSTVSTWACRIMWLQFISTVRKEAFRGEVAFEAEHEPTDPRSFEFDLDWKRAWDDALSDIQKLPAKQLAIIMMTAEEESDEDIAKATDCPIGTVKSARFYARQKIAHHRPQL